MKIKFHEEFQNIGTNLEEKKNICCLCIFFLGLCYRNIFPHSSFPSIGLHINGLAHAASGYHRVLEENRRLYNQVQDLKGNKITVCLKLLLPTCLHNVSP